MDKNTSGDTQDNWYVEEENTRISICIFGGIERNQTLLGVEAQILMLSWAVERQMCVLCGLNTFKVIGGCHSLEGQLISELWNILKFCGLTDTIWF